MRVDLTDVRALTVQPPWSYAITHLSKPVENRSWPAPQHVDWLLIHAGKRWDKFAAPFIADLGHKLPERSDIPQAAIVAAVRLAHVCDTAARRPESLCGCGPWAAEGQYHWRLATDSLITLHHPVPCNGALGLWRPPADVLRTVQSQIGGIR